MPLWVDETWECPRCKFANAIIRRSCRNHPCAGQRPDTKEVRTALSRYGTQDAAEPAAPSDPLTVEIAGKFDHPPLFRSGDFTLHSGQQATWKIDCDALTGADWDTLAEIAAKDCLGLYRWVEGVPTGGNRFAKALNRWAVGPDSDIQTILIADDVLMTGASMETQRAGRENVIGVVAFARGPWPKWVTPLFSTPGAREADEAGRKADLKQLVKDTIFEDDVRQESVAGLVAAVGVLLAGHDRGELPLHRVIEDVRAALERVKGQP